MWPVKLVGIPEKQVICVVSEIMPVRMDGKKEWAEEEMTKRGKDGSGFSFDSK